MEDFIQMTSENITAALTSMAEVNARLVDHIAELTTRIEQLEEDIHRNGKPRSISLEEIQQIFASKTKNAARVKLNRINKKLRQEGRPEIGRIGNNYSRRDFDNYMNAEQLRKSKEITKKYKREKEFFSRVNI